MPIDSVAMELEVRGGTLRARGDLGPHEEDAFNRALQGLMEAEHEDVVIDLSGILRISSGYVRDIALVMVHARQHGRAVRVRATKRVARVLSMGGVDKLGEVVVVE